MVVSHNILWVEANGFIKVLNSTFQLAQGSAGESPVVIDDGKLGVGVQLNGLIVIFDRLSKAAQTHVGVASIVVGIDILGVEPDSLVQVLESHLELSQHGVSGTPRLL